MHHFTFWTLIHIKSIEHEDLKVSDLQAHASLAQLAKHQTLQSVIIP